MSDENILYMYFIIYYTYIEYYFENISLVKIISDRRIRSKMTSLHEFISKNPYSHPVYPTISAMRGVLAHEKGRFPPSETSGET